MTLRGASSRRTRVALAAAALLAAAPGLARADSWALTLEPSYRLSERETRGVDGSLQKQDEAALTQQYRLTFDKTIYPYLALSGAGSFATARVDGTLEGLDTRQDRETWLGNLRLGFGPPILAGQLSFDRQRAWTAQETLGVSRTSGPIRVRDVWSASAGWRPEGGPTVDLALGLSDRHDEARRTDDQQTFTATLATAYRELRDLDLRASARYGSSDDRISTVSTREANESFAALWSTRFWDRRGSASASYSVGRRDSWVSAQPGATVLTQQFAAEGLSFVPAAGDLSTEATSRLASNVRLVDGEFAGTAGLDLGYGQPLADRLRRRELGVRFQDAATPVNRFYVWVDRMLPDGVWQRFAWAVWTSDDNVLWTRVETVDPAVGGRVSFGAFDARFEIQTGTVRARYVKLVTVPLPDGVTSDPAYRELQVTELQAYLARPADEVKGHSTETGGTLNAGLRLLLDQRWNLAFDTSALVTHGNRSIWAVASGLGAGRPLGPWASWAARLGRADSSGVDGHVGQTQASANLNFEPLPAAGGSLNASASAGETRLGRTWSASGGGLLRAEPYEGIGLSANGAASVGRGARSGIARSMVGGVSGDVSPHRTATLGASYSVSTNSSNGGPWTRRSRLEGNAAWAPFPALSVGGSLARSYEAGKAATLASFALSATPLRGGALNLRFGYSETLNGSIDERQRTWGPGARLTLRPGVYLDSSYAVEASRGPSVDSDGWSFITNLFVAIR
ncbi:MAG: hypothetical protein U0229_03925 [Anaeromyxobacter sp.]